MSQGDMTYPTIDEDLLDQDLPVTDTPAEPAGSILANLRAEYDHAADALNVTEEFDVEPSERFVIRYRWVPASDLDASAKQLQKIRDEGVQATYASCDTLIAACDEIRVYGPDGKSRPLFDASDENPEPLRFDSRLCEILGWPTDTSQRRMVVLLFKQNIHAIRQQAMQVSQWMTSVGAENRDALTGK